MTDSAEQIYFLFLHVKGMKGMMLVRADVEAQWCLLSSIFLLHQHLIQVGKHCRVFKPEREVLVEVIHGLQTIWKPVRENTYLHRWLLVFLPNFEVTESHRTIENDWSSFYHLEPKVHAFKRKVQPAL